jgi:nucleoside 2-deoxyribosyltransferase
MRAFLAAPFTQVLDESGLVEAGFRAYLTRVYEFLEGLGYKVENAHVREEWGRRLDTPAQAIALDLAGIDKSDVLIVLVGMAPSEGVQLEIGYAIGRDKRIVVVQDASAPQDVHYLMKGLPSVARAAICVVEDLADTERAIKDGLDRVL